MLNELQLANHYKGIGGSLAAAILGFDKYTSPLDAYLLLTNDEFRKENQAQMGEAAKWGNILEPVIANEVGVQKNWKLLSIDNTLFHPKYNFMIAHPDRLIVKDYADALSPFSESWYKNEGLEIKTRSAYRGHEYGDEESDMVLDTDMFQCQHYMNVTGLNRWHLAALIGGQRLRTFIIQRDDELINIMTERLVKFWQENVLAKVPPEPRTAEEAAKLYPRSVGRAVVATLDITAEVNLYNSRNAIKKEAEEFVKNSKDKISCYMKDADTLIGPSGEVLATYKTQDRKEYMVNASSFRVMRFK